MSREKITRVGIVGWRGMVGSVLLERMRFEDDFRGLETTFFTTSNPGADAPKESASGKLIDALDLNELKKQQVIISCQGTDYTKQVFEPLRKSSWNGYWIDAASFLRMRDEAVLILDPVNRDVIDRSLKDGKKTYVGPNCTVSLMLMATNGLFEKGLIDWVSSMTYQAASGAGAKNMIELMSQMRHLGNKVSQAIDAPAASALEVERNVLSEQRGAQIPTKEFGVPLAGSLIPWIDAAVDFGQTKEEWKGGVEANKILGTTSTIPVDGACVRVGVLRCHSQGLTIKLNKDVPLDEIESIIASGNDWVRVVNNTKEETVKKLTPAAISGTLDVAIGRIRKMKLGNDFITAFTVGDQLLWGAAEPLRRMLRILREG